MVEKIRLTERRNDLTREFIRRQKLKRTEPNFSRPLAAAWKKSSPLTARETKISASSFLIRGCADQPPLLLFFRCSPAH